MALARGASVATTQLLSALTSPRSDKIALQTKQPKFGRADLCTPIFMCSRTGNYLMITCVPLMSPYPNAAWAKFGVQIPDPKMDRIRCPPTVGGHPRNTKSWSTRRTPFQIDFQRVAGMSVPSKYVRVLRGCVFVYFVCKRCK